MSEKKEYPPDTLVGDINWTEHLNAARESSLLYTVWLVGGERVTVLDRQTGFGRRDVESGYQDATGYFWLASGQRDVREQKNLTLAEVVEWVKQHANTAAAYKYEPPPLDERRLTGG